MGRARVTIDLEPSDRRRLEAFAAANERKLSQELRLAIRYYLDARSRELAGVRP